MFRSTCAFLMVVGLCCLVGCGSSGGGGGGVLNQLDSQPDTDGDGFAEIEPPEGVDFDSEESIALNIVNTITSSQAAAASGTQLPAGVSLSARVAVNVTYPGGITQRLPGTFPVGPFELAFEIACPESIEVLVTVVATAPIIGDQPVTTFGPYDFTQDGDEGYVYECGSTVTISTFVDDDTGELGVTIAVE